MSSGFNVVFRGEVALDHDIVATRQKLAKAFNASDEKIAALFSGKPIVVKKNISSEDGIKLQRQLLQLGAITYLEPVPVAKHNSRPAASTNAVSHAMERQLPERAKTQVPVALALVPTESASIEHSDAEADLLSAEAHQVTVASRFHFPSFAFSGASISAFILIVAGISCLFVFSPYPDYVLRKGFAIGAVLLILGVLKLKR